MVASFDPNKPREGLEKLLSPCQVQSAWVFLIKQVGALILLTHRGLTVKVAGIIFRFQLRNKFSLLAKKSCPVQTSEERVLLHLTSTAYGQGGHGQGGG